MSSLVEGPWYILLTGIVIEAVLGFLLLQTGRGKLLWAMIGVAIITGLGLVAERMIVTDREAVGATLDAAVAAVQKNDLQGVLKCISPSAKGTRLEATWILERFEVNSAWIRDLDIKVNTLTSPPSAKATFQAIGQGKDRKGEIPYQGYEQRVVVELQKEGDRWLVTGCNGDEILRR
jgi:hypothetical protein